MTGQAMKHPSSRQVYDYWNARRGRRVAPERGDIEPGPIRRALGDTFILGRDAQGVFRFRLAGTRCCALFGRELKGSDFVGLWAQAEQSAMSGRLAAAVEETAGFVAGVRARNGEGADADLELLLLPLLQRDPGQTRLLGILAPLAPPYWLGSTAVTDLACGSIRHLGVGAGGIMAPRLVPGIDSGRIRRGLVVYDGGRRE
jgi:hypothetical protein